MMLSIYKIDNGYILESYDEDSEQTNVIEFDEGRDEYGKENRDKIVNMLYMVLDYFGERGSKHDPYRVIAETVKRT